MAGVIVPIAATTGVAFVNHWYNTGQVDLKIPVAGGLAMLLGAGISQVPGLGPVVASVAWLAFVAVLIAPVQSPAPVTNLNKIIGGL